MGYAGGSMDDARFVQLALEQGFVTPQQVEKVRQEQHVLADRGIEASQWFLLQDLGFVTEEQAKRLRKGMSSSTLRALEVDGYVIQGRLGAGGMGDVFRAENAQGQAAAVKLLNTKYSANPEYVRRFEREARAAERLDHPNICRGRQHGEVAGHRFLLMELVEGPSLKVRLQEQGPLDERSALCLLEQMADGLGHAWAKGVLHRDVKPANILLGPARPGHDEPFCAKICDFGLAKLWQDGDHADEDSRGGLTGAGLALGTPHYMSPEQASGAHDLDQRCDIYGLGATLYHALLGHTMYSGKSSAVIMYKQVTEQIDLGALRLKGARERLIGLLERMLAKDRMKRLATWAAVKAEVQAIRMNLERPVSEPHRRARPWGWIAAGGAVAAAAGLVAVLALPAAIPTVSPESFARHLADLSLGTHRTLRLMPGTYDPMVLGAIHADLHLVAAGPGVLIDGGRGPGLRIDAGARGLELSGLEIRGHPALLVTGGAVTCTGLVLRGSTGPAVILQGGALITNGGQVVGGLRSEGRAEARIDGTMVTGPVLLLDTDFSAQGSTFNGRVAGSLGQLRLTRCRIDGGGAEEALRLERGTGLEARELTLEGARVGLSGSLALAPLIQDLHIRATDQGIRWIGPADPTWSWNRLDIQAPIRGLPAGLDRP